MEMRKIACAVLVAAAAATTALATEAPAAAPGPASASFAATPAVGAVIGASVLSFFAFYLHPVSVEVRNERRAEQMQFEAASAHHTAYKSSLQRKRSQVNW
ncbi:unnamed protein product [Musa acuminata subsp. burmannicoides]